MVSAYSSCIRLLIDYIYPKNHATSFIHILDSSRRETGGNNWKPSVIKQPFILGWTPFFCRDFFQQREIISTIVCNFMKSPYSLPDLFIWLITAARARILGHPVVNDPFFGYLKNQLVFYLSVPWPSCSYECLGNYINSKSCYFIYKCIF